MILLESGSDNAFSCFRRNSAERQEKQLRRPQNKSYLARKSADRFRFSGESYRPYDVWKTVKISFILMNAPSVAIPILRQFSHGLSDPSRLDAAQLVGHMGAVQAQDYRMARWALGVRMGGEDSRAGVDEALSQGRIVRMHILRPTWHFVRAEDVRWMLRLSGRRIASAVSSYGRPRGLSESTFAEANRRFIRILSGGRQLTREQLARELSLQGWEVPLRALANLTHRAEADGVLCSGADDPQGNPTHALLEERIPSGDCPGEDEALARLAGMYFQSHAPASVEDFMWWSGLSLTQARRAVQAAGIRTSLGEFAGKWAPDSFGQGGLPSGTDAVRLLPSFDEYLIAYRDRSDVLDERYYPLAFNRYGTFRPVILQAGRVVGVWRDGGGKVDVSFFDERVSPDPSLLQAEIGRYRAFCRGRASF